MHDEPQLPARRFRVGIGTTLAVSRPRHYLVPCDWSGLPDELGPQEIIPGTAETVALYEARVAAGFNPTHPEDRIVDRGRLAEVAEAVCCEWEDDE